MRNLVWIISLVASNAIAQNPFIDIIDKHNELYSHNPFNTRIIDSNTFWLTARSDYVKESGPHWISIDGGKTIRNPLYIEEWKRVFPVALTANELIYESRDSVFVSSDTGKTFARLVINGNTVNRFHAFQGFELYHTEDSVYLYNRINDELITTDIEDYIYEIPNRFSNSGSHINGDTVVFYDYRTMYRSINGGKNWLKSILYFPNGSSSFHITKHFTGRKSYSLLLDSLTIYWQYDFTGRFNESQRIEIDSLTSIRDLHFFNKKTGILIDDLDRLHKTEDGGKTWAVLHRFNRFTMTSIQALSNKTFFIIGVGCIYKTTNWGVQLQIEEISLKENIVRAYSSGKNEISFVGEWQNQLDVSVYDLSGRVLLSKSLTEKEDLSHTLPSGVYLIQGIENGERVMAQKIVIK